MTDDLNASFPGFEHFYLLRDSLSDVAFRGHFGSSVDPLKLTRAEVESDDYDVVIVEWAMGGASPGDVIWTTSAHPIIIHNSVKKLLINCGSTGWQTYPVVVIDKFGKKREGYEGLQIVGRCGPIDLSRSEILLKEYPGGWYPQIKGHYFDETTWDGSDIFMHRMDAQEHVTAHILISEGLRDALVRASVPNLEFTRLTENSTGSSVYEIGLRYLLPKDFQERVEAEYIRLGVPRPR